MSHKQDLLRYSRQLPLIGLAGQKSLQEARVLVIGAGGLGCPVLLYLVAAGVGVIGITDGDRVDLSNLHRQVLFQEQDINKNKALTAKARLQKHNSNCQLNSYDFWVTDDNVDELVAAYEIVVDASDNFPSRYRLNRSCRRLGKPLVAASLFQFSAQLSVFNYQQGPCYECLYPAPPPEALIPNCAEGGILGVLAGVVGAMQATEVIKIILQQGIILSGKLLTIDLLNQEQRCYPLIKRSTCSAQHCSNHSVCLPLLTEIPLISAQELATLQKSGENNYLLIDVRQPYEREICHLGGELIPLAELEQHLNHFPPNQLIIFYCKTGGRSAQAANLLLTHHFTQVKSLAGGILNWIAEIDEHLTAY